MVNVSYSAIGCLYKILIRIDSIMGKDDKFENRALALLQSINACLGT